MESRLTEEARMSMGMRVDVWGTRAVCERISSTNKRLGSKPKVSRVLWIFATASESESPYIEVETNLPG